MAELFIDVLRSQMRSGKMTIHDFVVMPNHIHILITLPGDMSIEKAMQLIKGSFSFSAGKELGFRGEIWQRGFSDVRIIDERSFEEHRAYIANNPVKAGLAGTPDEFPFGSVYLKKRKSVSGKEVAGKGLVEWEIQKNFPQGLKPNICLGVIGTTKVVP
jgi:putative transposase